MEDVITISNGDHIKILMDKKRMEVLRVIREKKVPMTSKQVAECLGINASTVNFHTKKLCSIGVLEVVRTEVVNGIIAKYLAPTASHFKIISCDVDSSTAALVNDSISSQATVIFDKAKNNFLENCDGEICLPKRLYFGDLYLTLEEFREVNEILDHKLTKFGNCPSPDKTKYKIFISLAAEKAVNSHES